jgi:hypothetical protein
MGHQTLGIDIGRGRSGDLKIERGDAVGEPIEELETVIPATSGVGQEREGAELSEATLGPEGGPEGQALVEGDSVQAIFDHGADPDEAIAVFDEDAQVARRRIGNPDDGEALELKKVEQVAGVAAISLGLAHDHGPDLGGLANEEGMAQLLQERVKPQRVASAFDADRDRPGQCGVELLDGITGVSQLLLDNFASVRVEYCHLLLSCMQIAANENHEIGLHASDVVYLGSAEATNDALPFS